MIQLNELDDSVIFGTFNGLGALGFGRLYGAHKSPEIFELGHNPALQNSLKNPGDQIIFFKSLFPQGVPPFRVLGTVYHHRDNAGRLGFFGVGKAIANNTPYIDVLKQAISIAKRFDDSRLEGWEQIKAQFQRVRDDARPNSASFNPSVRANDVVLCVSHIREMWDGLLKLSASVRAMDRADIYFVDESYGSIAASPSEFLEMLSTSISSDKRSLTQEYETELKKARTLQHQRATNSNNAYLIDSLEKLHAAQKENLQVMESIVQEAKTASLSTEIPDYFESGAFSDQATFGSEGSTKHHHHANQPERKSQKTAPVPRQAFQPSNDSRRTGSMHLMAQQRKTTRFRSVLIGGIAILLTVITSLALWKWFD